MNSLDRHAIAVLVGGALFGILFALWQAPAPRFLYAFVIITPALALAGVLQSRGWTGMADVSRDVSRRPQVAFAITGVAAGFAFALASQKLNVRSALEDRAQLVPVLATVLFFPTAPEAPARLFRWRVNDIEVLTPVPRPIADTLGYHSEIPRDALFEQCSGAPLPCTPYLPDTNVRLRRPEIGVAAGFVRENRPDLAGRVASCLGELGAAMSARDVALEQSASEKPRCGDDRR